MEPAKLLEYEPEDAEQPTEGADQGQEEVADGPDPTGQQGGHGTRHVFSEQECLEALTRLIGLVALKIITPAQANSMPRAWRRYCAYTSVAVVVTAGKRWTTMRS